MRTKFHQRYQGPDETLEHFAMELKVLCSKAYKTMNADELEEMAKQQFILGVRNNVAREKLIIHRPVTLRDAIEYGRLLEVAGRTVRVPVNNNVRSVFAAVPTGDNTRYNNTPTNQFGNQFNQRFDNAMRVSSDWPRFAQSPNPNGNQREQPNANAPRKPIICFTCGKPGHKANVCRSGPPSSSVPANAVKPNPNSQKWNGYNKMNPVQNHMIIESDEDSSDSQGDGIVLAGSTEQNFSSILAVSGKIENHEIQDIIVDTGSAVSLISHAFYESFKDKQPLQPSKGKFMVANGSLLAIKGSVVLNVNLDNIEIQHKFLCVETKVTQALLGYDFLHKNKIDILTSANCIIVQNMPILTHFHKSRKSIGVILTEDSIITPNSEQLVSGQTEEHEAHLITESCCVIESEKPIEDKLGVLVACGLVTPSKPLPIRVANLSTTSVTLKAGTRIGKLLPIEEEDEALCLNITEHKPDEHSLKETIATCLSDTSSVLKANEKEKLAQLLLKYEVIISRGPTDLGNCKLLDHHIDTGDTAPIRMAPRRIPYFQQEEVQNDLKEKEAACIIRKSNSPWAFPIVVVRKKDGTARICVDYRKLNDVTKKDAHPLPRIDDIFDALRGAKYFSTLDLASGYHQVAVAPQDQEKTGFVTPWGHYEYTVMPFGLCNAPATFQRLMALVFSGLIGLDCLIYLDDIIIFSATFEIHLIRLDRVFDRLRNQNLKIKLTKCKFGLPSVKFLGHIVSAEGIGVDLEKISSIQDWKLPENVTEMRSFLGLASYYRRFIEDFGKISAPLTRMLENNRPFIWDDEGKKAFNELKLRLATAPILVYPDFTKPFILDTDASDKGIGAVLSQLGTDQLEHPLAYFSRTLNKHERNYSITRKELLAAIEAIEHFKCYLYGRKFTLRTDHVAIRWLQNFKEPSGQLARWLERLSAFDFIVEHRPGRKHANADALSRRAIENKCLTVIAEEEQFNMKSEQARTRS